MVFAGLYPVESHARPIDFDLLPIDDQEALFTTPAIALFVLSSWATFAGELAHFVLPDELPQLEPGLTHELADAFLQSAGDLLQRYMKLDLTIAPSSLTLKSADRFLAVHLVSSFHSDSPFFETQTHPEPISRSGGESLLSTG